MENLSNLSTIVDKLNRISLALCTPATHFGNFNASYLLLINISTSYFIKANLQNMNQSTKYLQEIEIYDQEIFASIRHYIVTLIKKNLDCVTLINSDLDILHCKNVCKKISNAKVICCQVQL